jgi:hypothetical protein
MSLECSFYELSNDAKFVEIEEHFHENSHENLMDNLTILSISGSSGPRSQKTP